MRRSETTARGLRAPLAIIPRTACIAGFGLASLLPAGSGAAARAAADPHALETPYGTVSWSGMTPLDVPRKVFVDAELIKEFTWAPDLFLDSDETLPDRRVLLMRAEGGSACPNTYFFITLRRHGHSSTKLFGSCGAANVRRAGDAIEIETEGACKPILIDTDGGDETRWRNCNAAGYRKWVYRNDRLELVVGDAQNFDD